MASTAIEKSRLAEKGEGHGQRGAEGGECIVAREDRSDADEAAQVIIQGKASRPHFSRFASRNDRDGAQTDDMDDEGGDEDAGIRGKAAVQAVHEGDKGAGQGRESAVQESVSLCIFGVSCHTCECDRTDVLSITEG